MFPTWVSEPFYCKVNNQGYCASSLLLVMLPALSTLQFTDFLNSSFVIYLKFPNHVSQPLSRGRITNVQCVTIPHCWRQMAGFKTGKSCFKFLALPAICSHHKNISQVMHCLCFWKMLINSEFTNLSPNLWFSGDSFKQHKLLTRYSNWWYSSSLVLHLEN